MCVCGMVEGSQEYNESIVLRLHQVCVWVGVCVGWRGGCVCVAWWRAVRNTMSL